MKYFMYILFSVFLSLSFFSCSDDYREKGIEGQWQMRKIIDENGNEQHVDSIFYLFKKGVFKYIKMEDDLNPINAYGSYTENDNMLTIEVLEIQSICPENECLHWDGEDKRTFTIKKRNSSAMELEFNNDLYVFRKY